jgi:hypothetical protein
LSLCQRQVSSQIFFIFLSGFQLIFSNAFEESAQKAARSPSRRGKYLNLIGTPDISSNFYQLKNSRTFPPPIFNTSNLSSLF